MDKTYRYSLTKEQLRDCTKWQNSKKHKIVKIVSIVVLAASIPLFLWMINDKSLWDIAILPFFLFGLSIVELIFLAVNKISIENRDKAYFDANQTEGKLVYEIQLCEKEFIVSLPLVGKVYNYLYDDVIKIKTSDVYAAVIVRGQRRSYIPIQLNDCTKPLVETLKSRVAESWRV